MTDDFSWIAVSVIAGSGRFHDRVWQVSSQVDKTGRGDWGPTPTHRNPATVELRWDGDMLTWTVNPQPGFGSWPLVQVPEI